MKIPVIIVFSAVISYYPSGYRAEQICDSPPDLLKSKVIAAEHLQKNSNQIIKKLDNQNIIFAYFSDSCCKSSCDKEFVNTSDFVPVIALKNTENTFRVWELDWGDAWEYASNNQYGIFAILDHAVEDRGWCLTVISGKPDQWIIAKIQKPNYNAYLYKVRIKGNKVILTVELDGDYGTGFKSGFYTYASNDYGKTWSAWKYRKKYF